MAVVPCLEAQALKLDEPGGIGLVVVGGDALHGSDMGVVEGNGGFAAAGDDVSLVEFEAHGARHLLLAFVHEGLERFPFRGIPEAVVDELGVLRDQGGAGASLHGPW